MKANFDLLLAVFGVLILIEVRDGSKTIMILYRMMEYRTKMTG
ncbi:hypothetical protein N507_0780 [Lacticaseibacillus rhamnosus DSM 14870]|nr:hypothetical protein N507_0780 [Lacticaseibacillus rhamnosus DSM 14870]